MLVWKLLTATSSYFASANSSCNCFIYLFISHTQEVVLWPIWKSFHCSVWDFFSLPHLKSKQPASELTGCNLLSTVMSCFHNKLSGACLLLAQQWENKLCFLRWDTLQEVVTVRLSIDCSELILYCSFVVHMSIHWSMPLICHRTKSSRCSVYSRTPAICASGRWKGIQIANFLLKLMNAAVLPKLEEFTFSVNQFQSMFLET